MTTEGGMHHFLTIPLEVRTLIYQLCLVQGRVFPYAVNEAYELAIRWHGEVKTTMELAGYALPYVNILLVCKATYAEAVRILYHENTFVLPTCGFTTLFFRTTLRIPLQRSWITSIEVSFWATDTTKRQTVLSMSHERRTNHLINVVWKQRVDLIRNLPTLKKLIINPAGAKCGDWCCDLKMQAMDLFRKGFRHGAPQSVALKHDCFALRHWPTPRRIGRLLQMDALVKGYSDEPYFQMLV